MARPQGSLNKRSVALLNLLKAEYDLDPVLELAKTCRMTVPLQDSSGEPVLDPENGQPVMVPYLKPNELINALSRLADKTYPNLKAQEIDLNAENLPVVLLDMRGVQEESKPKKAAPKTKRKAAPRKRAPAARKKT